MPAVDALSATEGHWLSSLSAKPDQPQVYAAEFEQERPRLHRSQQLQVLSRPGGNYLLSYPTPSSQGIMLFVNAHYRVSVESKTLFKRLSHSMPMLGVTHEVPQRPAAR